jgi:hypothetical protein
MPPERRPPDDPREWINRARSNLVRAQTTLPGVYLEDLCFDAQQAAEKAIKAVLIARRRLPTRPQSGSTVDPPRAERRDDSPGHRGRDRSDPFCGRHAISECGGAGHDRGAPTGRGDRRGRRAMGGRAHRQGVER